VDGTFGQVDEPRPICVGQCHEQIVGLYPNISPYGFIDCVVDLDELLWVAGAVIFVDAPKLELVRPSDLCE
jgi:hypothetical protein